MKKNVILIITTCAFAICTSFIWLFYNPIIIHKPYDRNIFFNNLYNPIDAVDFTQGKNKIIIYINRADIRFLPKEIKRWTLLECKSNKIIEDVKNNFVFERISNDTVETTDSDSRIFFFKNDTLVFSSKIMIEENISLRFQNTGWTFTMNYNDLINSFSKFKPMYFPIIKIN